MSYKYDIFISYRRNVETRRWIEKHFKPLLSFRVGLELKQEPKIFIDQQIESGTSWPHELAGKLATSRILIALWTKTYFNSKWCVAEMANMLKRENETSRRTPENPRGLVVPAIIHDGDDFPNPIKHIQYFEIQKCFNVRMADDSPRAEELDEILNQEAAAIAKAIKFAPNWNPQWSTDTAQQFYDLYFNANTPSQTTIPGFGT